MAGITDCCGLAAYVDGTTVLCNGTTGKLESPEPVAACVTPDYIRGIGNGVAAVDVINPSGVDTPIGGVVAIASETITNPYPCAKRLKIEFANGNLDMYVTNNAGGYTAHSVSFGLEVSLDAGATFRKLHEIRSVWNPALTPFQHRSVDVYKRSHLVVIGPGASVTPVWRCTYTNFGGANNADRVTMPLFDFEWEII